MALIALPCQTKPVPPPLTLAYLATLLEQRRHLVRIYDLAVEPQVNLEHAFLPLRSFRPQVVVVAGETPELSSQAVQLLKQEQHEQILPITMSRSGLDAVTACAQVLQWFAQQRSGEAEPPLPLTLDQLPLPARHLISLESYNLCAIGGALQTTLLIGALAADGSFVLRSPTAIVAELRSVSHEFGLRHYLIENVPLTLDRAWMDELLRSLCDAKLAISWEAVVQPEQLDAALVAHMARAGCELINFQLDGASIFESTSNRATLLNAVAAARQQGIFVRANLKLEPPYTSLPQLVDVAATFGLDDVRFDLTEAEVASVGADESQLRARARQLYTQGRDRQRLIDRFGATFGNLLWKLRGPDFAMGSDDGF